MKLLAKRGGPLIRGVGELAGAPASQGPLPLFSARQDDHRQRDLFPLPFEAVGFRELRQGLSRSCALRLLRNTAMEVEVQNTIAALNALYAGGDVQKFQANPCFLSSALSLGQRKSIEFIRQSLHLLGWPLVQQKLQLALALLVGFVMYLRPSEICRIKVSDVVFPVARLRKRHQKLVVALHPFIHSREENHQRPRNSTRQWCRT